MQELDAIRSGLRRHDDLVGLLRHQSRQCRDLLADAAAVWRDRAAQRAWQRYLEPQQQASEQADRILDEQRQRYAACVAASETAAEHVRLARARAAEVHEAVERAREETRRAADLCANAERAAARAVEMIHSARARSLPARTTGGMP